MISVFGVSDKGMIRTNNQDTVAYKTMDNGNAWGVVCDGMGGIQGGDIASRIAADVFCNCMDQYTNGEHSSASEVLSLAVQEGNEAIWDYTLKDLSVKGMGTTLVGAILEDGVAHVVNIGDSRAYLISSNDIKRITRDHSIVQDLVEQGNITAEQARSHPQKNLITRALGTSETAQADLYEVHFMQGDWLLLCSDGLINEMTEDEILGIMKTEHDPEKSCEHLLNIALTRGATDNVTVLLFCDQVKK